MILYILQSSTVSIDPQAAVSGVNAVCNVGCLIRSKTFVAGVFKAEPPLDISTLQLVQDLVT